MINYIRYDSDGNIIATGKILKREDLQGQAIDGCFVIEGVADPRYHKIENGQVVQKSAEPSLSNEELQSLCMKKLKRVRSELLLESDWTQITDVPLTSTKKSEWSTYRQQLRDLPSNYTTETNYENIVWPVVPD